MSGPSVRKPRNEKPLSSVQRAASSKPRSSRSRLKASQKLQRRRTDLFFVLFLVLAIAACASTSYTVLARKHLWSGHTALDSQVRRSLVTETITGMRGTIYDRNHQVLAQQEPAYTLLANFDVRTDEEKAQQERNNEKSRQNVLDQARENGTYEQTLASLEAADAAYVSPYVEDVQATADALASVLGDSVSRDDLVTYLQRGVDSRAYQVQLGPGTKRLTKDVRDRIAALKIPGISFLDESRRSYPSAKIGSNMLGTANWNDHASTNVGMLGLEQTLDSYLGAVNGSMMYQQTSQSMMLPGTDVVLTQSSDGDDVQLTIDSSLQNLVDEQMEKTLAENKASKAFCVVMEPETGRILAYSTVPGYSDDPSSYEDNIAGVALEPGSVFKPLVYAMAIEAGVYDDEATYRAGTFAYRTDEAGNIYRVNDLSQAQYPVINDALGTDYGVLTFADGLAHSSNIAMCELLTNYLNKDQYSYYLDAFRLFQNTGIEFVNERLGLKNINKPDSYLNSAFGQGSSLTILNLCQAYTALFNDGIMMKPYIVESITDSQTGETIAEFEPEETGHPISAATAAKVRDLMRHVLDYGMSGDRFAIDGLDMSLKTGTGEIYIPDEGYDKVNYTSSVVAAAPADDPKVMVFWGMQGPNYLNYSALPFQTIMNASLRAAGVNISSQPSDTTEHESFEMPPLVNHSLSYSLGKLDGKPVNLVVLGDGSSVIAQFPAAGTTVNSNDTVLLLTENPLTVMPDLSGWTRKDLLAFSELTGLPVSIEGSGQAVSQEPPPGSELTPQSSCSAVLENSSS